MHYTDTNEAYQCLDDTVDQYHAFPDQHLLQLGSRFLGYLTVLSRVPCARVVRCVAREMVGCIPITDSFMSNDSREVFLSF